MGDSKKGSLMRKASIKLKTVADEFSHLLMDNKRDKQKEIHRRLFNAMDMNGDGTVTEREFTSFMHDLRLDHSVIARLWFNMNTSNKEETYITLKEDLEKLTFEELDYYLTNLETHKEIWQIAKGKLEFWANLILLVATFIDLYRKLTTESDKWEWMTAFTAFLSAVLLMRISIDAILSEAMRTQLDINLVENHLDVVDMKENIQQVYYGNKPDLLEELNELRKSQTILQRSFNDLAANDMHSSPPAKGMSAADLMSPDTLKLPKDFCDFSDDICNMKSPPAAKGHTE